jgi:hypothetical protein
MRRQSTYVFRKLLQFCDVPLTTGIGNFATHPSATINATMEVIGGGLEAAGGAAFGVATSETGVGAVVGGVVAVDGGSTSADNLGISSLLKEVGVQDEIFISI